MSESASHSGHLPSSEFERARRVSRVLALLLAIGFWFMIVVGLGLLVALIWAAVGPIPAEAKMSFDSQSITLASVAFTGWLGAGVALAMAFVPSALALFHGQRIFRRFARSEVFTSGTIADIRAASFWMIVLALTTSVNKLVFNLAVGLAPEGLTFNADLLFFGLCVYVAAFVMAEAQRIADDNAGIV